MGSEIVKQGKAMNKDQIEFRSSEFWEEEERAFRRNAWEMDRLSESNETVKRA